MMITPIKTEEQYENYMVQVQKLIESDPIPDSNEYSKLELLTVLIQAYENDNHSIDPPDPIEAIKFRMYSQDLKQSDLVQYFGTRSRVSEVLSRKRPLTVTMIRELSSGLGISTDVLVNPIAPSTGTEIDWSKFPIKEMITRGYIEKITGKKPTELRESVKNYLSCLDLNYTTASFKRTIHGDAYSPSTKYSLMTWLARVVQKSRENSDSLQKFNREYIGKNFLIEIGRLSWFDDGPLLAREALNKVGISLVVEPHLKGTHLDGATLCDKNTPIIALTLRHDRLDNFWFTLTHELAHLWKHAGQQDLFLDDLDSESEDKREKEANKIARDCLISRVVWKRSEAFTSPSRESIFSLSKQLKIHHSIIAGRLRHEYSDYTKFADLLGKGEVRKFFL